MKRHATPLLLSMIALTSMGYLSACQKKGSGGTSAIQGVPARPAQQAKVTDTKTQAELQEGGKEKAKALPQQGDPQKPTRKEDPCAWGEGPECELAKDKEEGSTKSGLPTPDKNKTEQKEELEEGDYYEEEESEIDSTTQRPSGQTGSEQNAGKGLPQPTGLKDAYRPMPKPVAQLEKAYTGASEDGYRSHLMTVMADRMGKSANKDQYYKAAQAITRVKANIVDGILTVVVNHKESGKDKVTILGGPLNSKAGAARLTKMNSNIHKAKGMSASVFGSTAMSGTAVCADDNLASCYIMMIRLQIGKSKLPVWVITRSTNAHISFAKESQLPRNESMAKLFTYFANTNRQTLDSVKTVIVDSFEVIHGASGMKITAVMNDNQIVSARGPLVAPRESILTNVEWIKELEIQELIDHDTRSGFKSDLQNRVSKVHLLTNDGRREFTLNYGFAASPTGPAGDLDVTFSRVHPIVRDIEQIRSTLLDMHVQSEL